MRKVTEADRISIDELQVLAAGRFGELIKAVVDRPSFGNRSRGVDDPVVRARIADLVRELVNR